MNYAKMEIVRSSSALKEMWVQRFGSWSSIFLATTCIAFSLFNWTLLSGREYGYFYGVFSDPPTFGFAVHGPNYFQSMNIWYGVITLSFGVYLAARFLGSSIYGFIVRVLALCVAIFPFFNMLTYKYIVLDITDRYKWLQNSVYLDWLCIITIAVIIGIEIVSAMRPSSELSTLASKIVDQ